MKASQTWICGLMVTFAAAACGHKKDSSSNTQNGSGTVASSGGGSTTGDSTSAGVTTQADPAAIGVAGSVALSTELALADARPDTVLAFQVVGNMPSGDLSGVIKAAVDADGSFNIKLPQDDAKIAAIKAAKNPDGTYDRQKLAATFGPVPDSMTDADIAAALAQQEQQDAAAGGQAWVLVTMVSHAELTGMDQLVAEAESFKFIELPIGKEGLLALPTSSAKGDLKLGQITASGDDATASLSADSSAFTTDPAVLGELARTQKSLKFIRNIWMNTNPTTQEALQAAPYFNWASIVTKSANAWEAPTDSAYVGYGVGFNDQGGKSGTPTITLSDLCDKTTGNFVLTPPAALIPVDSNGNPLAPLSALDNTDTGVAQSDADDGGNASRMACSSQTTGFYAHSETGMAGWNWGGNGYSGKVADGLWKLALDGSTVANFDLASGTPLDANGNPLVFIPALNVTTDAAGLISQVQVKMYRYDDTTSTYAEVTDLTAFEQLINSSYISVGLGGGSTSDGAMYSQQGRGGSNAPLTLTGNVFSVAGSALAHVWMFPGSTAGAGQITADSIVVQYQMYGNTYRFDHRLVFGN